GRGRGPGARAPGSGRGGDRRPALLGRRARGPAGAALTAAPAGLLPLLDAQGGVPQGDRRRPGAGPRPVRRLAAARRARRAAGEPRRPGRGAAVVAAGVGARPRLRRGARGRGPPRQAGVRGVRGAGAPARRARRPRRARGASAAGVRRRRAGRRRGPAMGYSLLTIWHDRKRFLPGIIAVAFSTVLILFQGGLLVGQFFLTSTPVDNSTADLWV